MEETKYRIGDLINPLLGTHSVGAPVASGVVIKVPARVDTFLCHHQYFIQPPRPQVYPVNSINFTVEQYTEAKVLLRADTQLEIQTEPGRESIVQHAAMVMQKTLGITSGFTIIAHNAHNIRHGGLGSSAALMTAVAQAINVLFGTPLTSQEMVKLLAQNYGEETDTPGYLSTMASIGGAAASSILGSSVVVIGGEAEIWLATNLSKDYEAVFLYPKSVDSIPSVLDMELFKKGFELFRRMGSDWGKIKEEVLLGKIVPMLESGDVSELHRAVNVYTNGGYGDIPQYFRNRWLSHGIFFDEYLHELNYRLFKRLSPAESCFFVSSGGPLIVVITNKPTDTLLALQDFADFEVTRVPLSRKGPEIVLIP